MSADSRYDEKWGREMMRLSKKQLVEMVKSAGLRLNADEEKFASQRAKAIAHLRMYGSEYRRCLSVRSAYNPWPLYIRVALEAYRAIGVLKERK